MYGAFLLPVVLAVSTASTASLTAEGMADGAPQDAATDDAAAIAPKPLRPVAFSHDVIGFDDAGLAEALAKLRETMQGAGVAGVDVVVAEDCATAPACVAEALTSSATPALVRVTALRVGGDVEVHDAAYDGEGAVIADETRLLSVADFLAAPFSPSVLAAMAAQATPTATATTTPDAPSSPSLPLGTIVAVGGGVVAAIGLVGFVAEAGTLENPRSLGADKERARVTAWVFLGVAAVGAAAIGAGAVLGFSDDAP
jgi:hypothetical protein